MKPSKTYPAGMGEAERDEVYTRICQAITEAGPDRESLFLARLSLLLAEAVGDAPRVREAIEAARLIDSVSDTPAEAVDPVRGEAPV